MSARAAGGGLQNRSPVRAADQPLTAFEHRRVKLIWALLFLSSLPWGNPTREIFIPKRFEQVGTALCLGMAVVLALALNRSLRIRGAGFVWLYAGLVVVALLPVLGGWAGLGSLFRAGRFGVALVVMLLLSRYWMRDRDVLLESHLAVMKFLLVTVGLALAVGLGLNSEGRLFGQIPALEPPQVGQIAGVLAGVSLLLVVSRVVPARRGLIWCTVGVVFLVLSYTRTAMVALVVGLLLGVVSLITTSKRARAVLTVLLLAGPIIVMLVGPVADAWFKRGQDDAQFATLTGRTNAWDRVYAFERDEWTELFGVGLTDKSIDGLPIDSGMLSVYHEEGMVGVVIVVGILTALVVSTVFAPPGPRRAVALFLVTYCIVASYTETGVGDMSSYVLSLAIAASLVWGRSSRSKGPMKVKF